MWNCIDRTLMWILYTKYEPYKKLRRLGEKEKEEEGNNM